MPVYVYEIIRKDGSPGRQFEIRQSIHDAPLTADPKSGRPVRRIIAGGHFLDNQYDRMVSKLPQGNQDLIRRKITGD